VSRLFKQLSTARKPCVLRHDPPLFALSPNKFLLPTSSDTLFTTFFRTSQFPGASCHLLPPHHPNTPLRRPSPPFNLHRARARRNRGRLPSSRCIESAQTHRAPALTLPHRNRILLVAEGDYGIDLGGAARGDVGGRKSYKGQQHRDKEEGEWIDGANSRRRLAMTRVIARAVRNPTAAPARASLPQRARTNQRMSAGLAPRAIRIPISRVC
jgi:hypothetical protein